MDNKQLYMLPVAYIVILCIFIMLAILVKLTIAKYIIRQAQSKLEISPMMTLILTISSFVLSPMDILVAIALALWPTPTTGQ